MDSGVRRELRAEGGVLEVISLWMVIEMDQISWWGDLGLGKSGKKSRKPELKAEK